METIGDESERSERVSTDELNEEEDGVLVVVLTSQHRTMGIVFAEIRPTMIRRILILVLRALLLADMLSWI